MGTAVCVEDKEDVFPSVEAYLDKFPQKTRNRLATTMQLHDIFCLAIYLGQGKKITRLQPWIEKRKGSCFCLSRLFVESVLVCVHISCSPVNTIFHWCSLYFVCSHIQTNRIVGENEGVSTTSIEEDIERCMLVLLFHIALFCISFMVCICVQLVYYMYMSCAFLHGKLSLLHAFLHTNLLCSLCFRCIATFKQTE